MTDDNQKKGNDEAQSNELHESVAKISRVTPKRAWGAYIQKGAGLTAFASCTLIFLSMLKTSHSSEIATNTQDYRKGEQMVLNDNLQEMARLEQLEKQQIRPPVIKGDTPKGNEQSHHQVLKAYYPIQQQESEIGIDKKDAPKISKALLSRMSSKTTFFIEQSSGDTVYAASTDGSMKAVNANGYRQNQNEKFLSQAEEVTTAHASRLAHPEYTLPSGDVINATLMTAINSGLPGRISAIVSHNAYSMTNKVLVPKGSIVEGAYYSQVVRGQSRILTTWNRLRLPNGVVVNLKAPGTDGIGRAGVGADHINSHFVKRFGSSVLLSILGYYSATNGVNSLDQFNSESQYRTAIAESLQAASSQQLQENMNIPPTLDVHQGDEVNIFVNQDLSFYSVMKEQVNSTFMREK